MRFERRVRQAPGPVVGALFGLVLVAGGAIAAVWFRLGLPRPLCPLREWTGIPCFTCGSTRLVEAVLSGDLSGAFAANPLVFLGLTALAAWAAASTACLLFGLPGWRVVLTPGEKLALRILALAAVIADWAYLVWRGV